MAEALKIRKWGLRSDNNLRKLDRTPDSQVLSDDRGDNPVYAGLNPGGCRSPVKRGCNAGSCGERSIPTPERWPLRPATSLSLDLNAIRGRRRRSSYSGPFVRLGGHHQKRIGGLLWEWSLSRLRLQEQHEADAEPRKEGGNRSLPKKTGHNAAFLFHAIGGTLRP